MSGIAVTLQAACSILANGLEDGRKLTLCCKYQKRLQENTNFFKTQIVEV